MFIRHKAVPSIDPFSFLKIPVVGITLCSDVGPWLSLVERLNGVQEVESSNLSGPISFFRKSFPFPLRLRELSHLLFGWGCGLDVFFPATISEKEVEAVILSTLWLRFLFQFFWDRSKSFISIHSPLPKPLQPLCPTPPPTLLLLFAAPLPPILIICYTNNINSLTSF